MWYISGSALLVKVPQNYQFLGRLICYKLLLFHAKKKKKKNSLEFTVQGFLI